MQYSVFLVEASAMKMSNLIVQMAKLVDANADDVRAYHLPPTGNRTDMTCRASLAMTSGFMVSCA